MASPLDPDRLARLLAEHGAALDLFAAQWTNLPEDCVQEAFVELVRQTTPPENVAAWLHRVVRNRAIRMARSAGRRRRHETQAAGEVDAWFTASETSDVDAEGLTRALDSLPADQREVVVARVWGGLSFAETADVVGCSTSTAHRRYEAALKTLRERLGLRWLTNQDSTPS